MYLRQTHWFAPTLFYNVSMTKLCINIDHIATVREARKTTEPDPVSGAILAVEGGADGITAHLREDRRHINDRDILLLASYLCFIYT